MKKKKRLKLKKKVYYFGAFIVFLIVGILLGINYYNDYQYKQTNEYKLLEKGYSLEDTKTIFAKLSETEQQKLIDNDKDDKIISLLEQKYFLEKNLEDYKEYINKNNETDYAKVISIVNVHANHKWYQLELNTNEDLEMLMNVNKFYALSETYTPENLKNIDLTYAYDEEGKNKLIDYAYDKFLELWQAANDQGFYLMVTSSYRDYESQKEIYDYRVSTWGERKADETAARPGHSEHQTGLVIDMTSKTEPLADSFTDSEAYKWLKENAYKYGFIERYPEGKTYLTGYNPESWHWRYVGLEAAKTMHDEDITFDEYYAFYIEK
ncbi:D-alanyl-D-alanine carboxypeptidase family protein [bacterium]|nr:D-alanyl-D-alanine carboxypeptidase family protein [bacterium]